MTTIKFNDYEAAFQFSQQSGMLHSTKPYPRRIWQNGVQFKIWCVTLAYGALK